jgi:hypothetical protein
MQEDILEKYYKDVFGKYEGMPDFSELTQDQKYYMKNSLMYSRFAANWHLKKLAMLILEPVFKFIQKAFRL